MENSKMTLGEIEALVKRVHNKMYSISPSKIDEENINMALDVVLGIAKLPKKYQIIFGWAYLTWYDIQGPGKYSCSIMHHCANIISTAIDYFTTDDECDDKYDNDDESLLLTPCSVCGEDDEDDSNRDNELY